MTETAAPTALDLAIAPALERYSAAIAEHGHRYDVTGPVCRCGRTFRSNRAVGLHAAAAERRASKAYDAESAEAIRQLTARNR